MSAYAVIYTYHPETEEMNAVRPSHVEFLKDIHADGKLLVSGRLMDNEPQGALLIIRGESIEDVEALMDQDPIYSGGFVAERSVRRWNIVFGAIEGAQ